MIFLGKCLKLMTLIRYTVSVGIAQLTERPKNHMKWMQQADEALYAAKNGGRNCVVVFE